MNNKQGMFGVASQKAKDIKPAHRVIWAINTALNSH
jgi:hypothetical protein